ncbi:hypothetical protein BDR05DRAFT_1004968 [Suillus weaverae]|nr:hypothetical protein BDR05DRAFT_1004968 [Suillus weaverae]
MHFKGIENNANKSFSEKLNIADLVKEKMEYHRLATEEKEQLIIDFDKFVREELSALKECVGAEAFIIMVCGVSDFTMVLKAFFTSPAAEHFVHLYLHKDITQMATDFESTILANGLIMSEVMNDPAAVMEFKCYNDLVQCYHIKLIEWNHPDWANPSDLKGGIKSLKNMEAKEQMHCIKDGETLTPDLKPSVTPDLKPSVTPDLEPSLTPDLEPSMPPNLPTPNSTQPANIRVALSEPYVRPSSFTDEMVDPALRALDHAASDNGPPMVQLPPTPLMPTPLPIAGEAHVLVAATNRGKRAADVSTGTSRSKRARKLTEKGQSELESRTCTWCGPTKKGTQHSKKSNAHVESDHKNT